MTNLPLVSVLMTSYNREKYIGQAIESVLASTYKNFELIIVDNCSKDKTYEIAKSYAAKDTRVKAFQNDENIGQFPNRNKAAEYASGKYLKYVDDDDLIYPYGLEQLVFYMEQFPDAGWGLCSLIQIQEKPYPFLLSPKEAYEHHYFGPGLFYKAPLSSIIKKEAFEKVSGFRNFQMAGDYDMWHRLAKNFNIVLMPDGIVWYREHAGQQLNNIHKFVEEYEKLKIEHLNDNTCPLDKKKSQKIITTIKKRLLNQIFKSLLKLQFNNAFLNYKKLLCYL